MKSTEPTNIFKLGVKKTGQSAPTIHEGYRLTTDRTAWIKHFARFTTAIFAYTIIQPLVCLVIFSPEENSLVRGQELGIAVIIIVLLSVTVRCLRVRITSHGWGFNQGTCSCSSSTGYRLTSSFSFIPIDFPSI